MGVENKIASRIFSRRLKIDEDYFETENNKKSTEGIEETKKEVLKLDFEETVQEETNEDNDVELGQNEVIESPINLNKKDSEDKKDNSSDARQDIKGVDSNNLKVNLKDYQESKKLSVGDDEVKNEEELNQKEDLEQMENEVGNTLVFSFETPLESSEDENELLDEDVKISEDDKDVEEMLDGIFYEKDNNEAVNLLDVKENKQDSILKDVRQAILTGNDEEVENSEEESSQGTVVTRLYTKKEQDYDLDDRYFDDLDDIDTIDNAVEAEEAYEIKLEGNTEADETELENGTGMYEFKLEDDTESNKMELEDDTEQTIEVDTVKPIEGQLRVQAKVEKEEIELKEDLTGSDILKELTNRYIKLQNADNKIKEFLTNNIKLLTKERIAICIESQVSLEDFMNFFEDKLELPKREHVFNKLREIEMQYLFKNYIKSFENTEFIGEKNTIDGKVITNIVNFDENVSVNVFDSENSIIRAEIQKGESTFILSHKLELNIEEYLDNIRNAKLNCEHVYLVVLNGSVVDQQAIDTANRFGVKIIVMDIPISIINKNLEQIKKYLKKS